jgi:hypothetical protein
MSGFLRRGELGRIWPEKAEFKGVMTGNGIKAMSGFKKHVRFAFSTVPKKRHQKTLIESIGLWFWNSRGEKPDRITVGQRGVEGGRRFIRRSAGEADGRTAVFWTGTGGLRAG